MEENIGITLSVPPGSSSATGNPLNKVALKKGRGLMDWVRLGSSEVDLTGTGGIITKVSTEELALHCKRDDAWIALRGKVYNVTPYFEYHPGGEDELLRGVGKDATDLFNEVHKWVNFESMLKKCFVGQYVETKSFFSKPKFLPLSKNKQNHLLAPLAGPSLKVPSLQKPNISSSIPIKLPAPKYDWFQTRTLIDCVIYTKWKDLPRRHVIIKCDGQHFKVLVYVQDQIFIVHLELSRPIEDKYELKVEKGKIDILMKKELPKLHWSTLGKTRPDNRRLIPVKDINVEYFPFTILEKAEVTRDTFLFTLAAPSYLHFAVPFGYHVFIRIPKSDITKPYTPVYYPFNVPIEEGMDENLKLLIKIYPDGGFTPLLNDLSEGDTVEVSIPQGRFSFSDLKRATVDSAYVALIGAGTGITPLIKVMLEALNNGIKTRLILFNRTEQDIHWKSELDSLMETHSSLLKVTYILSSPSEDWDGLRGIVRKELLDELLPIADGDKSTYVCVCGSKGFTTTTLSCLEEIGCLKEDIHAFLA